MPLPILIAASSSLIYAGVKLYRGLKMTKQTRSLSIPANQEPTTPASNNLMPKKPAENNLQVTGDSEINAILRRHADRDFTISSVSLALTTVGALFYPPFTLLGMAGIVYISFPILKKGYHSLFKKHKVDMAVIDLVALPGLLLAGYYFLASVAYWFYTLSQKLLLKIEDQSVKSLINVFGEQPNSIWVLVNEVEMEIPFEALKVGDIVVVNAGEVLPIDGIITNGVASIDQHTLTGESQPAEKGVGEQVFASTIVLSGRIYIQVQQTGKDTIAAKIGELLVSTAEFKTTAQSYGEEVADKSALPSLIVSGVALLTSGYRGALAILFAQPGENMRVIAPLSALNFLKIAAEQGILIKDGRALELLSQVDTIVFDKTGTLTQEQPHIGKIYTLLGYEEDELLKYAAAAEYKQTHPIAKAILQEAQARQLSGLEIDDAKYDIGYGLTVNISHRLIRVGSVRFMDMENIAIPEEMHTIITDCHEFGRSLVMVAIDNQLAGAIELHATIRPEVKNIIHGLRQRKMSLYIISGDHEKPTQQLAQELEIDNYFADVLPENKANLIEQLQNAGKVVCFVGDGINDSIALKKAHVSISLQGASTIAMDTAQVILMDKSLNHLTQLFDLAYDLEKNLNTGLITTIAPGMTVVGGVFLMHFGIISSLILFNVGLVAGVTNSMLPLSQRKSQRSDPLTS